MHGRSSLFSLIKISRAACWGLDGTVWLCSMTVVSGGAEQEGSGGRPDEPTIGFDLGRVGCILATWVFVLVYWSLLK